MIIKNVNRFFNCFVRVRLLRSHTVLSKFYLSIWVSKNFESIKKLNWPKTSAEGIESQKLNFSISILFLTFSVGFFLLRLQRIRNQNKNLAFFIPIFYHISIFHNFEGKRADNGLKIK